MYILYSRNGSSRRRRRPRRRTVPTFEKVEVVWKTSPISVFSWFCACKKLRDISPWKAVYRWPKEKNPLPQSSEIFLLEKQVTIGPEKIHCQKAERYFS